MWKLFVPVLGLFSFLDPVKDFVMDILHLLDPVIEFLLPYGHAGLAIYTILETLLIIPPIEVILVPLVLANPSEWFWYSLNVIIFTFFASAIGYFIGVKYGYPMLMKMTNQETVDKTERIFNKYGILAVAVIAFTPVPYTIAVFMAGITRMDFKRYMVSAMLGRVPRFLIGAFAVSLAVDYDDSNFKTIAGIVGGALVLCYFIYDQIKRRMNKQTQ